MTQCVFLMFIVIEILIAVAVIASEGPAQLPR